MLAAHQNHLGAAASPGRERGNFSGQPLIPTAPGRDDRRHVEQE